MLVQYNDPELLQGYQPLSKDIQYRVLAISTTFRSGSTKSYALLWDPDCTDPDKGVASPWFVALDGLNIVDASLPNDWQATYFSEHINDPSLVYSFKEMSNRDFFIRIHDANAEHVDLEILRRYFDMYGGNLRADH